MSSPVSSGAWPSSGTSTMPRLVRRARMASTVAADRIYAEEDIPLAGIGPDGMGTAGSRP
jgi:hypothetical protein